MKIHKLKAVLYLAVGIGHLAYIDVLPSRVLAAAIAIGALGLSWINFRKWRDEYAKT